MSLNAIAYEYRISRLVKELERVRASRDALVAATAGWDGAELERVKQERERAEAAILRVEAERDEAIRHRDHWIAETQKGDVRLDKALTALHEIEGCNEQRARAIARAAIAEIEAQACDHDPVEVDYSDGVSASGPGRELRCSKCGKAL